MSGRTGIEWTEATWNPVVGCERISPGCAHCYAKTLHDRRHEAVQRGAKLAPQYAHPFERVQLMPNRLDAPLHWRKPRRVFVNSVSDLFHEDVPFHFIDEVFYVMREATRHTFQVLTKRPARMLEWAFSTNARFGDILGAHTGNVARPLPNVWVGVSVENQRWADERIPLLLQMPAAVRFLSCEPLLGPVSLRRLDVPRTGPGTSQPTDPPSWTRYDALDGFRGSVDHKGSCAGSMGHSKIDWVIAGGESGRGARPCELDWLRSLRDQCDAASVAYFLKQLGGERDKRGGEKAVLDGRRWTEMPTSNAAVAA